MCPQMELDIKTHHRVFVGNGDAKRETNNALHHVRKPFHVSRRIPWSTKIQNNQADKLLRKY